MTELLVTPQLITEIATGEITHKDFPVKGFWSAPITVYHTISWYDKKIKLEVKTASGGRDTDAVQSDIEAYSNFAEVLQTAIEYLKSVELQKDAILAEYKIYSQKRIDESNAKRQAFFDANITNAKRLTKEEIKEEITNLEIGASHAYYKANTVDAIFVTRLSKTKVQMGENKFSLKDVVGILSNLPVIKYVPKGSQW